MPAEQVDLLAGQEVGGRYRLIRRIGKGGMGVVYEAEHVGLDKRVAVKFLLERFTDDPEVVERFHREARTASRIGQDNIIDVFDVGRGEDGRPYLVMELLGGHDLAAVLAESGPMPALRAVHVIRQILRGLEAAHGKGIVHRDMKPENVFLITRSDDGDFVKIMDFGISKVIAANDSKVRLTATGAVIGTPIYMAPEQALAQTEVDHRVDLYAVGVMLFELLAGRPPFLSTSYLGLVTQHINAPAPSLAQFRPDLPPALVAVVARALEKDPARRWASAAEMARALPNDAALRAFETAETLGDGGVRVMTGGPIAASPRGLAETTVKRRTAAWVIGGAVLVAAGLVAYALATRGHERGEDAAAATVVPVVAPDATPTPAPAPEPQVISLGKVDVRATPAGAKVYIDGVYEGPSPVLVASVAAGEHQLRLELDGYQTLATSVIVGGGKVEVVSDALVAVTSSAVVPRKTPKTSQTQIKKPTTTTTTTTTTIPDHPHETTTHNGEKPNPYE